MTESILGRVAADARREERQQLAMLECDKCDLEFRRGLRQDRPSRFVWWFSGIFTYTVVDILIAVYKGTL